MRTEASQRGMLRCMSGLAGALLVLQVTACSSVPTRDTAAPSAIPTSTVAVAAKVAVEARSEIGAHISEVEAQDVLARSKTHGAYHLANGEWVLTDLRRPLPKEAQRDADRAASKVLRKNAKGRSGNALVDGSSESIKLLSSSALDSPQRQAVTLVHAWSSVPDSFPTSWHKVWIINGIEGNGRQVISRQAGVAAYKHYVKLYYKSGVRPALVVGDINR